MAVTGASAHDAVVVGAGVNGLVAACYLARAGLRTLVVEARPAPGGLSAPHTTETHSPVPALVYALDRTVLEELKLARLGLRYAVRDLPLVGLPADGKPLVLTRNAHASAASILSHSARDAANYARFRRSLLAQARAARLLWWNGEDAGAVALRRLTLSSATSLLDSWFESDTLKAALAFDATAGGVSVDETPSSLLLLWRAAQENSGLQGATGIFRGGAPALIDALREAAGRAGVDVRTSARAAALIERAGAIAGVVLEDGEEIEAKTVLSAITRSGTRALLPPAATGIGRSMRRVDAPPGAAQIWLQTDSQPSPSAQGLGASRFVFAERPESYSAAHSAARDGRIPDEIVFEAVGMPANGGFEYSVLVRPLPRHVAGGWKEAGVVLLGRVVAALNAFDRGLKDRIRHVHIATPDDIGEIQGSSEEAISVERMLAPARARIESGIEGLYLCGCDAEPVSAISGRAARFAANTAAARFKSRSKSAGS
jgi:phytoene dehydrogenase-like protein